MTIKIEIKNGDTILERWEGENWESAIKQLENMENRHSTSHLSEIWPDGDPKTATFRIMYALLNGKLFEGDKEDELEHGDCKASPEDGCANHPRQI